MNRSSIKSRTWTRLLLRAFLLRNAFVHGAGAQESERRVGVEEVGLSLPRPAITGWRSLCLHIGQIVGLHCNIHKEQVQHQPTVASEWPAGWHQNKQMSVY